MNVQDSFDLTIRDSTLKDVGIDIAEIGIDSILDNQLLQQIPIVKTFIGFTQAGVNIQDRLFLKKILTFLQGVDDIPTKKREEMIKKIDTSKKYRMKVGEKLLYILDNCNDYETADNVTMLFKAFLKNEITYDDYLRSAPVIAGLDNDKISEFLSVYVPEPHGIDIQKASPLLHTGFFILRFNEVDVNVGPAEIDSEPDVDVSGGETYAVVSNVGHVIFKVFAKKSDRARVKNEENYRRKQFFK